MGPSGVLILSLISLSEFQVRQIKEHIAFSLFDVEVWQIDYIQFTEIVPYRVLINYTIGLIVSNGMDGDTDWYVLDGETVGVRYIYKPISERFQKDILSKYANKTLSGIGT